MTNVTSMPEHGSRFIDMTRRRFGLLKVIILNEKGGDGYHSTWVCRCECGNVLIARGDILRRGSLTSCGCTPREEAMAAGRFLIARDQAWAQEDEKWHAETHDNVTAKG